VLQLNSVLKLLVPRLPLDKGLDKQLLPRPHEVMPLMYRWQRGSMYLRNTIPL
jgi:hypothetical protein